MNNNRSKFVHLSLALRRSSRYSLNYKTKMTFISIWCEVTRNRSCCDVRAFMASLDAYFHIASETFSCSFNRATQKKSLHFGAFLDSLLLQMSFHFHNCMEISLHLKNHFRTMKNRVRIFQPSQTISQRSNAKFNAFRDHRSDMSEVQTINSLVCLSNRHPARVQF